MKIKFALLGIAHGHGNSFIDGAKADEAIEVVGAYDDCPDRRRGLSEKVERVDEDWRKLLDETTPDAVGIAAVNGDRGEMVLECAKRGIHVLSDKPLLTDIDECDRLIELVKDQPNWLCSIAFTMRFHPESVTLRHHMEKGSIGKLVSIQMRRHYKLGEGRPDWMFNHKSYGGVVTDIGSHDIDLLRWYAYSEITEFSGRSSKGHHAAYPDFQDIAHLHFRLDNGITANLEIDWMAPKQHTRHTVLIGECGILQQDDNNFHLIGESGSEQLEAIKPETNVVREFFSALTHPEHKAMIDTSESLKSMKSALLAQKAIDFNSSFTL